jgi:hypothetical protein
MSYFHPYETKMTDPESICAALRKVSGFEAQVFDTPQKLHGYPHQREFMAEIVVPGAQVGRGKHDIGYQRQEDGTYTAIISDDNYQQNKAWRNQVTQAYVEEKQMKVWRQAGYTEFERREVPTEQGMQIKILAKVPQAPQVQKVGFSR